MLNYCNNVVGNCLKRMLICQINYDAARVRVRVQWLGLGLGLRTDGISLGCVESISAPLVHWPLNM